MVSVLLDRKVEADGHAHSFQHFHGPVVGKAHEVTWEGKHGHHDHDYVAHPHYEFSYGVEDHHTGDYHGQKEHRDGRSLGEKRKRKMNLLFAAKESCPDSLGTTISSRHVRNSVETW